MNKNKKILVWLLILCVILYIWLGSIYYRTEENFEKMENKMETIDEKRAQIDQ